jgi:hypothetical protein
MAACFISAAVWNVMQPSQRATEIASAISSLVLVSCA